MRRDGVGARGPGPIGAQPAADRLALTSAAVSRLGVAGPSRQEDLAPTGSPSRASSTTSSTSMISSPGLLRGRGSEILLRERRTCRSWSRISSTCFDASPSTCRGAAFEAPGPRRARRGVADTLATVGEHASHRPRLPTDLALA